MTEALADLKPGLAVHCGASVRAAQYGSRPIPVSQNITSQIAVHRCGEFAAGAVLAIASEPAIGLVSPHLAACVAQQIAAKATNPASTNHDRKPGIPGLRRFRATIRALSLMRRNAPHGDGDESITE
ncbi:hypothetical protein [Lysobacter capsici]|uniref:hypothetical protein n=1 Tax=Lysobacter capsici TaxID=435897 RepID=UPI00128DE67B|nr:hypothetical protein [Lysobacter capsici]